MMKQGGRKIYSKKCFTILDPQYRLFNEVNELTYRCPVIPIDKPIHANEDGLVVDDKLVQKLMHADHVRCNVAIAEADPQRTI